jgi:nitrogen regulatory protein PII
MKFIIAFIFPEKLAAVQAALNKRDLHLMTVSEVLDCGRQQSSPEIYRGREFHRPVSQFRLEIAVKDAFLVAAVDAIAQASCSADRVQGGGDNIFVMGLEERGSSQDAAGWLDS